MNTSALILWRFTGFCFLLILLLQSCAEVFELPAPQSPPRITDMSPDSGAAGQTVVIAGENFSTTLASNAVRFNGKEAKVTKASATELTALVPDHAGTGSVEVVVKKKATAGPVFTFFETPLIASLSPNKGQAGIEVTLKGNYFDTTATHNTVRLGGKLATVLAPASDTLLKVTVPADAITGAVTVTVNGITGTGPQFTVVNSPDPVLTITSISPTSGTTGTVVTINGANFGATSAEHDVKFNGKAATNVTVVSSTQLKATVPAFAGTGLVSITVKGKTANFSQFTYVWPTPVITSITPTSGGPATVVTITGNNFFDGVTANNVVKFNGKAAVVNSATLTQLKAVVPDGAGTGLVSVTVQGSTGNGPTFTYIDTSVPTITNYDPNQGFVGDVVAIVGTNFSAVAANNLVKFNGTVATITQATATLLKVTIPTGATTGPISVTVNGKTATGASFTVLDNSPNIVSFTPASGPVGTGVTITGTNFGTDPAAVQIKFNGVLASPQQVSPTSLLTVVPQGATTGKITVTVNGKTATSASSFTVTSLAGWVYTGSMNEGRSEHTATLLSNGKVLVVGGLGITNDHSVGLASVELYDPATAQWSVTGSLNTGRFQHTATLLANGKVLVTGGKNYQNGVLYDCELYDPATGQWTLVAQLVQNRLLHRAILLKNGKVLVVGGNTEAYYGVQSSCELYDVATNTWTATGSLPEAKQAFGLSMLADGKILATGGETNGNNGFTKTCFLFDPATGKWTATGSLASGRISCQTFTQPNGKVLVIGGASGANQTVAQCELYDPTTGTWSPSISLKTGRYQSFAAVMFTDGSVLVTGGLEFTILGSVELISLKSGFSVTEPALLQVRASHTATLLPSGKVLVTGGGGPLAICEIFTP
jgi:hypothetical protein